MPKRGRSSDRGVPHYKKIIFFLRMYRKKNYCTIVCDGKRRSIYSSILIKSKIKILFSTKSSYKILFKYFFTLILLDKYAKSKILEIHDVVRFLKFNYTESDLNTINIKINWKVSAFSVPVFHIYIKSNI